MVTFSESLEKVNVKVPITYAKKATPMNMKKIVKMYSVLLVGTILP
jgi:hypothetical protein